MTTYERKTIWPAVTSGDQYEIKIAGEVVAAFAAGAFQRKIVLRTAHDLFCSLETPQHVTVSLQSMPGAVIAEWVPHEVLA